MIEIIPHSERQMIALAYEVEDISFLSIIIQLIGDRNTLLKEMEHEKKDG